ncbi:site-specific integrase [Knoellia sp. p5-6-4]|uniref:tyrosine-type recombinase/integrase n=1 Tax=unclassified Knoellia TaxID=2618719 RepID=UPI0023DB76BD|nr:site-specific integrase [Knoellia sp. p5-6-4]MDF2144660.1 tyrosine-type recombinase/integrase [Knoellia sp. p5-6-4]
MIEKRVWRDGKTVSWRVRYRGPDGRQRNKSFDRRRDAEAYEDQVSIQIRRGDWIDPRRGQVRLVDVWREYHDSGTQHLRETTRQNYRAGWRNIEPHFGDWRVNRIEHADVADWIQKLSEIKGPETVRQAHRVLCLVLDFAIQTRRLALNPARGVRLPRRPPARERILTVDQVASLADELGRDGDLVFAMAYLGLRWSELAALRVSDVDLQRRRVRIVERATEVGGRMDVSAPKSRASRRSVAIPALLEPVLRQRTVDRGADELVFPAPDGGYLRNGNWRSRSGWARATTQLGLEGVTPHDLRRTFGSLARAAGADLRWIQRAMGHESINTTARIYAHLYDEELDIVAAALDRLSASRVEGR